MSWIHDLRAAINKHEHGPLTGALATVGEDDTPRVRTIVIRRLLEDGRIAMCIDLRSEKMRELSRRPTAALNLWIAEVRQQFRMRGLVEYERDTPLAQETWNAMQPANRAMFKWPQPGAPKVEGATFIEEVHDASPPENFVMLLIRPEHVDVLDLSAQPHRRTVWLRLGSEWQSQEVNP